MIETMREQAVCLYCSTPMLPGSTNCCACGAPLPFVLGQAEQRADELEFWTAWQYRQPPPDYSEEGPWIRTIQYAKQISIQSNWLRFDFPQCGFLRYFAVSGLERVHFRLIANGCITLAGDEVRLPISLILSPLLLQLQAIVSLELEFYEQSASDRLRLRWDATVLPAFRRDWDRIGKHERAGLQTRLRVE